MGIHLALWTTYVSEAPLSDYFMNYPTNELKKQCGLRFNRTTQQGLFGTRVVIRVNSDVFNIVPKSFSRIVK